MVTIKDMGDVTFKDVGDVTFKDVGDRDGHNQGCGR